MADYWKKINENGKKRILVTRSIPGRKWLDILISAGCSVEIYDTHHLVPRKELIRKIGSKCDGVIGQLDEDWDEELFAKLALAGGKAFSNYAVGYDNVDLEAATRHGIIACNTPGVLTGATAELGIALSFAAARNIVCGDNYVRKGKFHGWLPKLFLGKLMQRRTLGVIGAGRIGGAYARRMVSGFKMDFLYHNRTRNDNLENYLNNYNTFLKENNEEPVVFKKADNMEELLRKADLIAIFVSLNKDTHHLINTSSLKMMKRDAVLINVSRGAVIDEEALVEHCQNNSDFRCGLDVYEDEPKLKEGLDQLTNVVLTPHLGSGTFESRTNMSILAARNLLAVLNGYKPKGREDIKIFVGDNPPDYIPAPLNAG
jgi:hydroxypyruvate reductase 1